MTTVAVVVILSSMEYFEQQANALAVFRKENDAALEHAHCVAQLDRFPPEGDVAPRGVQAHDAVGDA